jgi:pilus assembly protein Flp/PilA
MRTLIDLLNRKVIEMRLATEEGQDLAEYGLIIALIAIACIAALTALGGDIGSALSSIGGKISAGVQSGGGN